MTTVLLAHPSAELYGSDLQLVETVIGLVEAGARAVVVLPSHGPLVAELHGAGARVELLDMPVLRKAHMSARGIAGLARHTAGSIAPMLRLVRAVRPDAVLVNTLTIPVWLLVARLRGIAPVCHVHEAEADAARPVRVALNAPLLLARHVVVNSVAARDVVVGAVGALRRRTQVVHNGVAGPVEPPACEVSDGGRGARPTLVVLVGRLSQRKGTDVALAAIGRLRSAGRDVRIALCGSVFAGYEWFEEQLRERASEEDLDGAVDFVGYADVWEWFARADVVVVPSRVEPFGNVAVQALLAQRPLVASRTQGLAEIVRDGETGIGVPPDDPAALAEGIAELLDHPERAAALAAAGRKDALERFAPERYRRDMAAAVLPAPS